MSEKEEICELLDKLTLENLSLIEQQVQSSLNLEKITNEGQLLMAKSRYIQGHNSVSSSQLPTENSIEFKALARVSHKCDDLLVPEFELETNTVDKSAGYIDPMNWFGVLLPQSLHAARDRFRKAIELSVECVNIKAKLAIVNYDIWKLKQRKEELFE